MSECLYVCTVFSVKKITLQHTRSKAVVFLVLTLAPVFARSAVKLLVASCDAAISTSSISVKILDEQQEPILHHLALQITFLRMKMHLSSQNNNFPLTIC